MMEKFVTIRNGILENGWSVNKLIANMPDGRYLLRIEKKNKRSNNQNNYYWACVVQLVFEGLRDAGYNEVEDATDAHEILKNLFLKKQIANNDGLMIEKIGTTTKLTTIEFNEYLEKIYQWASEYLSVYIPPPNQQSHLYKIDH